MGMTIWLNVRDGAGYENDQEDHCAVFYLQEPLDALADKLGVAPISSFFDDTDVRYNLDDADEFDESDEFDASEGSEEGWPVDAAKWFPAEEVLACVTALHTYLCANLDALPTVDGWTQSDVVDELGDLESGLRRAAEQSRTVHLCIVM